MSMFETLKQQQLQARKDKNNSIADRINVFISDIQRSKPSVKDTITDDDIQTELKATIKRLSAAVEKMKTINADTSVYDAEIAFWNEYLTKDEKMPVEDLTTLINSIIESKGGIEASRKLVGAIMAELKNNKLVDMKVANQLVREILK